MNRKEAIAVAIVVSLTFISGAFADTVSTSRTGGTVQTTSTDIEVVKFGGIGIEQGGNAYTTPTVGILMGNVTEAFSFSPGTTFQQVNSVRATIVYQAGSTFSGCSVCTQPGDRLVVRVNGMVLNNRTLVGSYYPITMVVPLGNVRPGSNVISVAVVNLTDPYPGFYYVYEVRLTVEYTFLA